MKESMFKFVVSFLHYNGENKSLISPKQYRELFQMGDGFGEMTPEQLTEFDLWGDWSHIRDSSDEAIEKIYNKLAEWFGKPTTYVRHKDGLVWMQMP